jgi:hypothetical protein
MTNSFQRDLLFYAQSWRISWTAPMFLFLLYCQQRKKKVCRCCIFDWAKSRSRWQGLSSIMSNKEIAQKIWICNKVAPWFLRHYYDPKQWFEPFIILTIVNWSFCKELKGRISSRSEQNTRSTTTKLWFVDRIFPMWSMRLWRTWWNLMNSSITQNCYRLL